jgi:membrane-associated phospholipid phosphatase
MDKIELPEIANETNKYQRVILFGIASYAVYTIAQNFHFGDASYLEMSAIDSATPFIPVSIWPYVLLYPFNVGCFLYFKQYRTYNLIGYAFLFMQAFASVIFILFPVAYPREFFPLPMDNSISTKMFELIRHLDQPTNCLPSLHVANCFMMSYGFLLDNKRLFLPAILLTLIISFSTLTTKQHYFVDVISGFAMASIIFFVFNKFFIIRKNT